VMCWWMVEGKVKAGSAVEGEIKSVAWRGRGKRPTL
jgi:hypothetical protein